MARHDALIRFYHKIDHPDQLSDEEYCERVEQIMWVLKFNGTIEPKQNK